MDKKRCIVNAYIRGCRIANPTERQITNPTERQIIDKEE
jgi:hypothetical protein